MTTERQMQTLVMQMVHAVRSKKMPITAQTFEDAGIERHNTGLVIETADGSEFMITIVKSR